MPSLTLPVVAYHDLFRTDLTAQDAADEQAHRARLDAQADAAAAEIAAFLTAQEQEEDEAHDEPVTGIGEEW
jgi:hypothetical protein